jgi:DNA-binding CsgD family transcriptional regulator
MLDVAATWILRRTALRCLCSIDHIRHNSKTYRLASGGGAHSCAGTGFPGIVVPAAVHPGRHRAARQRAISMPRPWSEERKKRLAALTAAGRSPAQIATALGLPRETVIARLRLMDTWARNAAIVEAGFEKRAALRRTRARTAVAAMARAIARGTPRNQAIANAHAAGATWREIGEHLGITAQAARVAGAPRGRHARGARR